MSRNRAIAAIVFATVLTAASPVFANTVSIGPQAMEGDLHVNPGDVVRAGISFTIPGSHPATIVQFTGAEVIFGSVVCVSGSGGGSFGAQLGSGGALGPYSVPQNDSAWFPTGDQSSAASYQASIVVPNLCNGGTMSLRNGGTFTGDLQADQVNNPISIRFHYSANGSSGSWSATKAFTPSLISSNPVPGGTTGILLLGGVLGVVFLGLTRRRRVATG